jgi:hypothetical protein
MALKDIPNYTLVRRLVPMVIPSIRWAGRMPATGRPHGQLGGQDEAPDEPGSYATLPLHVPLRPRSLLLVAGSHQAIVLRSRKKRPLRVSGAAVASQTAVSAPSSTERVALAPPISVRTQPGHIT